MTCRIFHTRPETEGEHLRHEQEALNSLQGVNARVKAKYVWFDEIERLHIIYLKILFSSEADMLAFRLANE